MEAPINKDVLTLAVLFLLLFAAAELLYRFGKVRAEITRKLVHIGTGLLTVLFPLKLDSILQAAVLCGSFFVVLLLATRYRLLPSIHAISRKSSGSLLYPVSVLGVFTFYNLIDCNDESLFYIPILILAVCDPLAALVGKLWAKRRSLPAGKTTAGSLAFFAGALAVIVLVLSFPVMSCHSGGNPFCDSNYRVPLALLMALATTFAERVSGAGWDNLTIPAAAVGVYLLGYALV